MEKYKTIGDTIVFEAEVVKSKSGSKLWKDHTQELEYLQGGTEIKVESIETYFVIPENLDMKVALLSTGKYCFTNTIEKL